MRSVILAITLSALKLFNQMSVVCLLDASYLKELLQKISNPDSKTVGDVVDVITSAKDDDYHDVSTTVLVEITSWCIEKLKPCLKKVETRRKGIAMLYDFLLWFQRTAECKAAFLKAYFDRRILPFSDLLFLASNIEESLARLQVLARTVEIFASFFGGTFKEEATQFRKQGISLSNLNVIQGYERLGFDMFWIEIGRKCGHQTVASPCVDELFKNSFVL